MLLEMILKVINVFTKLHVKYCPRGMLAFGSSLVLYDRLRSAIALEYEPIYTVSEGFSRSAKWYDVWFLNFKNRKPSKNTWADRAVNKEGCGKKTSKKKEQITIFILLFVFDINI